MDDGPWWSEAATPHGAGAGGRAPAGAAEAARARQQFAQVVQKFLVDEGVGVLLERGSDDDTFAGGSDLNWRTQRTDGGTIFPTSGGSRDPKVPAQVPSATLAVEHYNRLVRLIERGVPVQMEVDIKTDVPSGRRRAERHQHDRRDPGHRSGHEVVIMGAHMDGVPYATGATDNATGTAAMMEAVRVIQALGLRPRRTIRVALWGGEEQGLLGSRAYVAAHFWDADARRPKPDHANVAAYFNLDNGTGRIRGIWGQAQQGRAADPREVGRAAQGPRLEDGQPAQRRRHRSRRVRRGGPARLPVHPGAPRVQLALAPLEHGHLRPRAEGRRRTAGRRGRGVRVAGGELAGEAAAQADGSALNPHRGHADRGAPPATG